MFLKKNYKVATILFVQLNQKFHFSAMDILKKKKKYWKKSQGNFFTEKKTYLKIKLFLPAAFRATRIFKSFIWAKSSSTKIAGSKGG